MKLLSILTILTIIFGTSCSKEEPIAQADYETVIIESISLEAIAGYNDLDTPGKPDLYFEIILEPSTFVTTGLVMEDTDLPVLWNTEIRLPGDIEASYFIRFSDRDPDADDQIFAVTLRPNLAWPNTTAEHASDGNQVTIENEI